MRKMLIVIIGITLMLSVSFFTTEKSYFSENENRNLFTFPEFNIKDLLSGEYFKDIDSYINDHFNFRNTFLKLKTKYELFLKNTLINGVYVSDNYLFLKYEKNSEINKVVSTLNNFYNNIDIEANLILVPSSSLVNTELLPKFVSTSFEKEDIKYVLNNLNFPSIDVYDALVEENQRYDVYFKTDHHYSIYGANAVYKSFCEYKNFECVKHTFTLASKDFYGTLSSKVNIFNIKDEIYYYKTDEVKVTYEAENLIEDSLYDYGYLLEKDKYSFFLKGNHSLITIETSMKNDKSILVIKDSYANSFIPFLTDHYEEIHVIDLRFYNMEVSKYALENDIDEVLFFYSTSGFNSGSGLLNLR